MNFCCLVSMWGSIPCHVSCLIPLLLCVRMDLQVMDARPQNTIMWMCACTLQAVTRLSLLPHHIQD